MNFFDINNIAVTIGEYYISYTELIGTLFGLISVFLASRGNILTWPTGIVNEVFLFILLFQVHLYADMFLQIYFFATTLYGWYNWSTNAAEKNITKIRPKNRLILTIAISLFTILFGFLFSNIHIYLPHYFIVPAAYPFADSLVMLSSIVATVLLARRKIENWYLWILVDAISTGLYLAKHVYFLAFEYFIFLGIASYGYYHWQKQLKDG